MTGAPALRRVGSASAATLADLAAIFEELQTTLRCCERLVTELSASDGPDDVVVEGLWTVCLLSYARCFSAGESGTVLTEADVEATHPGDDVLAWHKVLMQLRDHYADPKVNPRERFSVGVAQDEAGAATGVGITSARQPLVDEVTVRQTGAVAFGLSTAVNDRITAQQAAVLEELGTLTKDLLDKLAPLDVVDPDPAP